MINIRRIKTMYECTDLEGEVYDISNTSFYVRITSPISGLKTGMIFAFDIDDDEPTFIENGNITELAINEGVGCLARLYEDYITFKEHKDEIVKEYREINKTAGNNKLKTREENKMKSKLNRRARIYSKLLKNGEITKDDYKKKIEDIKHIYNISNSPVMEETSKRKRDFNKRLEDKYDLKFIKFDNIPNVLGNIISTSGMNNEK
jgi:hypothetical protein